MASPAAGRHQFIEALVWLRLQGHVPRRAGRLALWAYLLIALVALPVLVPVAVIMLEPTKRRKLMMTPFAVLLTAMISGLVTARLAPTTSPTASGCRTVS